MMKINCHKPSFLPSKIWYLLVLLSFGFSVSAQYSEIYAFDRWSRPAEGHWPISEPYYENGWLYFSTSSGGSGGFSNGTFVKVRTNGSNFSKIIDYGGLRNSTLVRQGSDLYFLSEGLRKIDYSNGNTTALYIFNDFLNKTGHTTTGKYIYDGDYIYGMCNQGGLKYGGTIFKIKFDGSSFTKLFDFSDSTGRHPEGGLTLDSGYLYGVTSTGGVPFGSGTFFRIKTDGTQFDTLKVFVNYISGGTPVGSLLLYKNKFYGMTNNGGPLGGGTIFRINKDGSGYEIIKPMDQVPSGSSAQGSLIRYGAYLYGMTNFGGHPAQLGGVIFRIHPETLEYTVLHNFTNLKGPSGSLTRVGDTLFGTLSSDITTSSGGVFRYNLNCSSSGASTHNIKNGDTVRIGVKKYTSSGLYKDTLINAKGCDSMHTANITKCKVTSTQNINMKQGDSFFFGTRYYKEEGIYLDSNAITGACDSIFQLQIRYCSVKLNSKHITIRNGDSILFGNKYVKNAGFYSDTFHYIYDCDSINHLNLLLCQNSTSNLTTTIKHGDSVRIASNTYKKQGTYIDTIKIGNLCDSIVILNLKVIKKCTDKTLLYIQGISKGDSVIVGNKIYKDTGQYIDTFITSLGCDSIIRTYILYKTSNSISTISDFNYGIRYDKINQELIVETTDKFKITIEVYAISGLKVQVFHDVYPDQRLKLIHPLTNQVYLISILRNHRILKNLKLQPF